MPDIIFESVFCVAKPIIIATIPALARRDIEIEVIRNGETHIFETIGNHFVRVY